MSNLEILASILEECGTVIFDFDNVVVDSEPYHYKAYSGIFAARGHTIDRDEYWIEWTSKGGGAEGEIERYGLDLDPDEIRTEKDPVYSRFCSSGEVRIFPAALKVIRSFHNSGYTLAIASGSYERDIRAIISAGGIEDLFTVVVGKDGIKKTKPDPETYERALELLGIEPRDAFAIEDAEKGIISAHAAGMKVIAVETGLTRGFDLDGADLKLGGIGELYGLMIEAGLEP